MKRPSRTAVRASSAARSARTGPTAARAASGRAGARQARFRILFLDGPNLNVLGRREPGVYGTQTLAEIRRAVTAVGRAEGASVAFFQSNHEGEIVSRLQRARDDADGIVINPGGYTHTSVAVRDALVYAGIPSVEVHLSNPSRREPFRRQSLVEDVVVGRIAGFGGFGYVLALLAVLDHLRREGGLAAR